MTSKYLLLLLAAVLCSSATSAQAPETVFQLDGSPANDSANCAAYGANCDYWNLINTTGVSGSGIGHSTVNTYINGFTQNFGFQTGGSKDYLPISGWQYTASHGPNKDAFAAGYAAAYNISDFDVIFGADRQSPSGDANIGIWFFQDNVTLNATNGFNGSHKNRDVLITSAFTSGGGTSSILVFLWDQPGLANTVTSKDGQVGCSSASKIPKNTSPVGYCSLQNLLLVAAPSAGAECTSGSPYCAITNSATVNPTWATAANGYPSGQVASPLFFEGGVDITQAFASVGGTVPCFASFLEDTRSSQSGDAILHFFLLGQFPVCGVEIVKQCPTGSIASTGTTDVFQYTFGGVVHNKGFATIHSVVVTDAFPSDATAISPAGGSTTTTTTRTYSLGDIGAGLCKEFPSGNTITCPNPFSTGAPAADFTTDTFRSGMNGATNSASVSSTEVSASSVTATCPTLAGTPAINVTKSCSTSLSSTFAVGVTYSGDVCNESNLTLTISSTQGQPTDTQIDGAGATLASEPNATYGSMPGAGSAYALPIALKPCTGVITNSSDFNTPECTVGQTCNEVSCNPATETCSPHNTKLSCINVDNSQAGSQVCAHYTGAYTPTQASEGSDASTICLRDKVDAKAHSGLFNQDATGEAIAHCTICPGGTCAN